MSKALTPMTLREMNLRVFQQREIPQVFFQPRFEPWFELHQQRGDLPALFQGKSVFDAYQSLDVSMRYLHYATGSDGPVTVKHIKPVDRFTKKTNRGYFHVIKTPYGELATYFGATDQGCRIIDFPIKNGEDLRKLEWYFRNTEYHFNQEAFDIGAESMGDLGVPQFFVPRSPYQALALDWMRFEDLVYMLYETPEDIERVCGAIDDAYDTLYADISQSDAVRIVNFGENVDARLLSPDIFERFHLPFYEKRAPLFREAGIYTTIHLDGNLRSLLPYLHQLPVDGLEALTPLPQGDVTLEELRDHIGEKILLDGIPAVYFLEDFPLEILQECVEKLVAYFAPRLVLGISDELPMGAGPEAVERLIWIRDFCRACKPGRTTPQP